MMKSVNRRQLLTYLGSMAAASALAGCGNAEPADTLHLQVLAESLPPQAIGRFRRNLSRSQSLRISLLPQLADSLDWLENAKTGEIRDDLPLWQRLLQRLQGRDSGAGLPELVTLGDTWLSAAIDRQLLQPFNADILANRLQLPAPWQEMLRRDEQGQPAPKGQIWGLPYRWGTVAIAYRRDKLSWQPQGWADLWHPDLRDRLSLPDTPRLAIGLALKTLGETFNHPNPGDVSPLPAKLAQLQQQAKYYSSRNYLQPLVLGDTWAAVGWSADLLPIVQQYPKIAAIVPAEGTALWADLWVRPQQTQPVLSNLAQDWLDFCWQPEISRLLSRFAAGTSPTAFPDLQITELTAQDGAIARSEFLLPLAASSRERYRALWLSMRQGNL